MRFGLRVAGPVLALLAAPISAFAEITRFDEQVSTFDLDNGMEVVVIEDHRAPVVVHMMWYRAGSADEQPVFLVLRISWSICCSKQRTIWKRVSFPRRLQRMVARTTRSPPMTTPRISNGLHRTV